MQLSATVALQVERSVSYVEQSRTYSFEILRTYGSIISNANTFVVLVISFAITNFTCKQSSTTLEVLIQIKSKTVKVIQLTLHVKRPRKKKVQVQVCLHHYLTADYDSSRLEEIDL